MADSTSSRADKVAELVQKLKRGEITKAEMFQQLSSLSKPGGGQSSAADGGQVAAAGSARESPPVEHSASIPKVHAAALNPA
jgi:hypothetical protein